MAGSKFRTSASTDAATDGVTRVEIVTRGEARWTCSALVERHWVR